MQGGPVFNHSLGNDLEPNVAHDGDAAPCYWSAPKGSVIGDLAGDGGEVGMGRGKEMQFYLR